MKSIYYVVLILVLSACKSITTLTTTGTSFGIGNGPNSNIDGQPVSQKKSIRAYNKYKKTIEKCNPCRLIQKDVNGIIISEGYAIKHNNGSHHHSWFGELIKFDTNGDTLNIIKDSVINVDEMLLESPNKIRQYITENNASLL